MLTLGLVLLGVAVVSVVLMLLLFGSIAVSGASGRASGAGLGLRFIGMIVLQLVSYGSGLIGLVLTILGLLQHFQVI